MTAALRLVAAPRMRNAPVLGLDVVAAPRMRIAPVLVLDLVAALRLVTAMSSANQPGLLVVPPARRMAVLWSIGAVAEITDVGKTSGDSKRNLQDVQKHIASTADASHPARPARNEFTFTINFESQIKAKNSK